MSELTSSPVPEATAKELKLDTAPKFCNLFQKLKDIDVTKVRMTDIGVYSVTPWREAHLISRWITQFYKGEKAVLKANGETLRVTDATANVGGNTLSFHLNGFSVNAVENDKLTAEILKHNLEVYKIDSKNVHNCDYVSVYETFVQDVVFIDAPWGGSNYKLAKSLSLYLSGVNVSDLCANLLEEKKASLVALKVPFNFNLSELKKKVKGCKIVVREVFRGKHHSYTMLFCMKK